MARFAPFGRLPQSLRLACLALAAAAPCLLALLAGSGSARAQAQLKTQDVLKAVVGVRAEIRADARTAPTLGRNRVGNGVVIDSNGLVLTVGYLILEAEKVTVLGPQGSETPANVLAYDWETGFGLLRTNPPVKVTPMALGDSSKISETSRALVAAFVGPVKVLGVTVVSRREFAGYWEYVLDRAIFTSPVHPTFGGAALIGRDGKLVGIGSLAVPNAAGPFIRSPGNMFIPIDALKPILADLLTGSYRKKRDRPWLGAFTAMIRDKLFVLRVSPNGPAAAAGITRGDQLLALNGRPITTQAGFYRAVWASGRPGVTVTIKLLRGKKPLTVEVRTGSRYGWLRIK